MRLFGGGSGDQHCSLETVSSFLDSVLRDREMLRVETHLASCEACAKQVEEMQAVVGVLRAMPMVAAPRSFAIPVPAAPAYVSSPSRPWWQPAPMVGFRAVAAAAALALAVVFAGDMSGVIGTPETPIQVGLTETPDFVTDGSPPGPEKSQVLGETPETGVDASPVVDVTGDTTTAPKPAPTLEPGSWFRLELWPLELALLALTAALAAISIAMHRRSPSV